MIHLKLYHLVTQPRELSRFLKSKAQQRYNNLGFQHQLYRAGYLGTWVSTTMVISSTSRTRDSNLSLQNQNQGPFNATPDGQIGAAIQRPSQFRTSPSSLYVLPVSRAPKSTNSSRQGIVPRAPRTMPSNSPPDYPTLTRHRQPYKTLNSQGLSEIQL